ncbi:MAG: M23 family metallopeptidase [Acidobacteria bacterium]|nr:M23 family metallopeptidase [Acidobacteriota bacterium]
MQFIRRALVAIVVIAIGSSAAAWFLAGREAGPAIEIKSPGAFIGQKSSLELFVDAPAGKLTRLTAALTQGGKALHVFSLDDATGTSGDVKQASSDRLWIIRPLGKASQPELVAGPATLTITAARPVLFGWREAETTVKKDLTVRLEPPRVGVVSTHHFLNLGGSEFVVLRATPPDISAGVTVAGVSFPAFPGASVGLSDPALKVAFFALPFDQDANTPVTAFARDEAGNSATASVERQAFPKVFQRSRIPIDTTFLSRVVPAIASNTPALAVKTDDLLAAFLTINRDLRQQNNATIAALAAKTAPEMLWKEAFAQLGNTQVESRFADHRTYIFEGREVDQQTHLGFDLASTQQAPVTASNKGVVVHAAYLGIYGNCVIVDHGLGVQSLYAHLSTIDVKEGDAVEKGQTLGRSGTTGLAGGDHLHFTMLVGGVQVNPVEFWDGHWMEDRVFRKIREAGGSAPAPARK